MIQSHVPHPHAENVLFSSHSTDFAMPSPEDQLLWSASLGLDLAERAVLEAEVLVWRIVQRKAAALHAEPRVQRTTLG